MKRLTREWVDKAEGDWHSAQRDLRARKHPNYDAACFHAQQCAEKYLKARLQEAGSPFGRTHDLGKLLTILLPVEPGWSALRPDLLVLTDCAVEYRYPGSSATRAEAQDALRRCRRVRATVRRSFGLSI